MATPKYITITVNEGQGQRDFILPYRDFQTGSRGFRTAAKVLIDGKRYQLNLQAVEIGSKNS